MEKVGTIALWTTFEASELIFISGLLQILMKWRAVSVLRQLYLELEFLCGYCLYFGSLYHLSEFSALEHVFIHNKTTGETKFSVV